MLRRTRWLFVTTALALLIAACGSGEGGGDNTTSTESAPTSTEAASPADVTTTQALPDPDDLAALAAQAGVESIGFVGFWSSNSFTQGVLSGVEEAAARAGVEVVDLSPPAFDAAAQAATVQDVTVSGAHQMLIILASDSVGILTPVEDAMDAGITVVASFVNLGPDFDSLEPAVDGLVVAAETPTSNGRRLADMAILACEGIDPCRVAYLEGLTVLPLDNARTQSFIDQLSTASSIELVAQVEGGYDPDSGQSAAQDVIQANPDIHVMVGSSQAMIGAAGVVDLSQVKLIGNGASQEAHDAVLAGDWFAHYNFDILGLGTTAVELGLRKAAGLDVEPFDTSTMRNPLGTADVISDNEPAYSDLG